jgi:hypothetical protein
VTVRSSNGSIAAAVLAAMGTCASANPALAGEKESIRLEYEAPAGCPSQAEFVARVGELGGDFQADMSATSARRFRVSIEGGPLSVATSVASFVGNLRLEDARGRETSREVSGKDCESVVGPLSLFFALALDETRDAGPPPATPKPASATAATDSEEALLSVPAASADMSIADLPKKARGGLAGDGLVMYTLGPVSQPSYGGRLSAATLVGDGAHLGLSVALANVTDGSGFAAWTGATLGWGAPWTDGALGFSMEAGLRLNRMRWADPYAGYSGDSCVHSDTCAGTVTPTTSEAPYVAVNLYLVPWRRGSLRPYVADTFLASTDIARTFEFSASLNAGVAWQAW